MEDNQALLLVNASEHDANMYYATRFFAPDNFIYLETNKERIVVIGNLELERAKTAAKVDRVLPLTTYWKMAQEKYEKSPGTEEVVDVLLTDLGLQDVIVPPDFSVKFADGIRKYGHDVQVKPEPYFDRRLCKEADEVDAVRETVRHTEAAISLAIEMIKKADIGPSDILMVAGSPLTSEVVRHEMHSHLIANSCHTTHTTVSCGEASALPHEEGAGPLYANKSIVIDCSPRSRANGYWADMTRTVVRGKASPELRSQYEAVLEAQEFGMTLLKPGGNAKDVHAGVSEFLSDRGYKTHVADGKPQGFFHAVGHGIGVDAHERPFLALRDMTLAAGNVLAIEPGLYYTQVGGIRIEDNVLITEDGPEELSSIPKDLEV